MILYYFVEFAGSFANIALLLLFIGRLFPKKEPVSKWFYVYVVLMIAGQCALSLFPDWVTPVSYTHLDVYKRQSQNGEPVP